MGFRLVQITIMGMIKEIKKCPHFGFLEHHKREVARFLAWFLPQGRPNLFSTEISILEVAVFVALLALTRALYVTQEELLFCGVINLFAFLASPAALSYPGDSFIHVLQFRATLRNLMLLSVRVYHYPRLHAFFFISLLIRGCQHIMLWLHFTDCSRTKDG